MAQLNIEKRAKQKLKSETAWRWYKLDEPNKGFWNNDNRYEILAKEILEKGLPKLFAIKKITRTGQYALKSHNATNAKNKLSGNKKAHLDEELICRKMFLSGLPKAYSEIGNIIDYETPLQNTDADEGLKGIDLLSYNTDTDTLILLETKRLDSSESLLRAVLEVFTYWKIADHQKLLYDFGEKFPNFGINPSRTSVRKAVLLFERSSAFEEYVNKTSPNTIALMQKLGVDFYGICEKDGDYEIFIPED